VPDALQSSGGSGSKSAHLMFNNGVDTQGNLAILHEMSVLEQHRPTLAAIIGSHDVSDAFVLDQHICERLSMLTDPRGEKVL
jgi:hypothetical protein